MSGLPWLDSAQGCGRDDSEISQGRKAGQLRFLKEVQGWDVEKAFPSHGPLSGKDALQKQALYLEELRKEVGTAIAKGLSLEETQKAVIMEA